MDLNLTLTDLKFANVASFSRTFGTKKTGSQNGGSLTTEEFNIANAIPFDKQRPFEITENSRTGNVEFNANIVINQANVTLTLNNGTYKGVRVNVFAQTAGNVVHDTNVTDSLLAGERASYEWNGTSWDYVGGTPLGALTYTARCTTALGTAKAVSIPGFTLKDGTTVEVLFTNGHYVAASSDPMTLNVNSLGAKPIYAVRDGSPVVMPNHSCTRSESGDSTAHNWVIQANTFLKLMYDSSLDSDNGGWLVLGKTVVLSSSSANESYTIYADGYIEQKIRVIAGSSETGYWVQLPIPYSNTDYFIISISNDVATNSSAFNSYAGTNRIALTGHATVKEVNGFKIKLPSSGGAGYRDNFTYGY